ncbi:DUF3500 domain-containing protein [Kocuria sp. JC486]|uniref:DUF3500 domain-containing protein n=1 Tax=Kocuria sp. JC486 TaxID=1970736 RepID=UPI001FD75166|nr:DUF3500 domain-containing protein [Kocuria sp. JC486]
MTNHEQNTSPITFSATDQNTGSTLSNRTGGAAEPTLRNRLRIGAAGLVLAAMLATTACSPANSVEATSETSSTGSSASSSTATETTTSSDQSGTGTAAEVQALAEAFADTLDDEQRAQLYQEYSFDNASNWSNFPQQLLQDGMGGMGAPGEQDASAGSSSESSSTSSSSSSSGRVGLDLGSLKEEQRSALEELMKAAMGSEDNEGYDEVMSILAADDYLAEQNASSTEYGSDNYYIAFLGEPTDSGTWELQFGGHHLAVSNTYTDGELVSATPSFRGTEPTGEFSYDGETYDPLTQETDAFTALLDSLTDEQRAEAEIDQSNLLLGPGADWQFPEEAEGIKVSELTDEQKQLVLDAIATYVDDLPEEQAAEYMQRYEAELDDTYISFSGNSDFASVGDYVRIDGPSVWIELAMQNGVATSTPHIHSVWRDSETDYAGLTAEEETEASQS